MIPRRIFASLALCALLWPGLPRASAEDPNLNVKQSTVFIASYDYKGDPVGRGSGFYVDEGIVITNIHVIGGAARYYRIYTTNNDARDTSCYKDINRSDIKVNLEDDVAYIRVFINCPHGKVFFADSDPKVGESIGIFGYPALGTGSTALLYTQGKVIEETKGGLQGELEGSWFRTNGKIHAGNSGGPVVQNGAVVGIAVAAHMDGSKQALDGYFIPVSQILRGLEYANDSTFAYTPSIRVNTRAQSSSSVPYDPFNPVPASRAVVGNGDCRASLGEGGEATGFSKPIGNACKCRDSYHRNAAGTQCVPGSPASVTPMSSSASSRSSSSRSSVTSSAGIDRVMYERVCTRVIKRFGTDKKMKDRVNERVKKRFGFVCS